MNISKFVAVSLITLIGLSACKKDKIDPYANPSSEAPIVTTSELLVQVIDEVGAAVADANVDVYGYTKTTDANGVAQYRDIAIPSESCVIKVTKGTYHTANYVLNPSASDKFAVVVTLYSAPAAVAVSASDGGTVTAANGGSIVFQKNSFQTLSGSEYSGTVNVYASSIDPATSDKRMGPNSFIGRDKKGEKVFVENHGMMIVELKDASGNELRLDRDKPAEIHIPISSSDNSDNPNKLDLYYFHEGYGEWIEDGKAKKDGDEYVGDVSHFTFWMCPYVYDHYSLSGQITCSGTNISGATVEIYNQWGAFLGSVTTNSAGGFSGSIPGTITHTLKVLDPCDNVIYSDAIGPFSAATNLGNIDICSGGNVNYGIVIGSLEDCSGNPEDLAYLKIQSTGMIRYLPAVVSGTFNQAVIFCNGAIEAQIMGVNQSDLTASPEITLPISNNMDFGTQAVCGTPQQFCAFNYDGTDFYYTPNQNTVFQANIDLGNQNLNELRVSVTPLIKFSVADFAPGVGSSQIGGSTFSYTFQTSGNDGLTNLTVNLTTFGSNTGDIIEGTVDNATYDDSGSNSHTITNVSFRFITG